MLQSCPQFNIKQNKNFLKLKLQLKVIEEVLKKRVLYIQNCCILKLKTVWKSGVQSIFTFYHFNTLINNLFTHQIKYNPVGRLMQENINLSIIKLNSLKVAQKDQWTNFYTSTCQEVYTRGASIKYDWKTQSPILSNFVYGCNSQ